MDELERIRQEKMKKLLERMKLQTKIEVNDSNFNEKVIKQSERYPVVVDFWATWCMPCLVIGPILEKLVKEYDGKFILAKLNVDENPLVARKYNIMSIPAVKMFKNGNVVDEFVGALPEPVIRKWLEKHITKGD